MIKMKASVLVCWIIVFQSMLIASFGHSPDSHRLLDDRDVDVNERSSSGSLYPLWTANVLSRGKRHDGAAQIPTRHSKHRKRRRCKNRAACPRGTAVQRSNEMKHDRDLNNTVLELEEESRSGMTDRAQEYNETKGEDYDVADVDEETSGSEGNGKLSTVAERSRLTRDDITDSEIIDAYDDLFPSGGAIDDQIVMHEGLSVLLSKLFQSLRSASGSQNIFKELNFVNRTNEDPCQKWLNSKDKLEQVFLGGLASLPACPCQYPSNIFYDDNIWDERRKRYFRWRDVSGDSQRLDVYKPGAAYCVRSLLTQGSGSAAAQHCCYDRRRKLLTRGSGAGTPNFVSPEISPILHERIDVLPWRLCKGDFSRYNGVRPPNNDNGCEANPDDEEYQRQIDNTKYY